MSETVLSEMPEVQRDASSDAPRRELRAGGLIAGLFFVGVLGWAAFTPLDAGAYAEGMVVVSGSRQAVQHREGGIVTGIFVSEGQDVRQGQVLLSVSAPEAVALERGLSSEVIALLAQRARLSAEQTRAGRITTPGEFASLTGSDRELAEEAMEGQRLLFEARANSLQTERGVLAQRIAQHQQQIVGFTHQMESNREQRRLLGEELEGLRILVPRGFVSINRLRGVERSGAELDGNHGAYRAEVARAAEAAGEARIEIVGVERRHMEQVATQAREVQVRLDELQPRLASIREQLSRSIVRAPSSGRVVGLRVFTVGGVVAPGDLLMEVVPQNRALVIEARASPADADDLSVGMETQVRLSALQERNLPILQGRVTKVSADSLEDERSGARYFRIEVEVPPEQLAILRQVRPDGGMRAGLPAEVMIPLRKRTALAYLVEPLSQTLWRAGREH